MQHKKQKVAECCVQNLPNEQCHIKGQYRIVKNSE